MKAIIMAGGEGTRLRPLTVHRPKPLIPIMGKPVMEHIVNLLKRHNIRDLVATVHYLADEIEGYFGQGEDWGVYLRYSVEDMPLGTAGSVKKAMETFDINEPVLVISGDALTDIDLSRAIAFHRERSALVTIILVRVPNPLEYGIVITNEEGRIIKFLEKPSWDEAFSDTVNTGIYLLEPEVLNYVGSRQFADFSLDVFPLLLKEGKPVYGFIADGYWCDIGNQASYITANFDALEGKVKLGVQGKEIMPGVIVGDDVEMGNVELTPPIYIGEHARLENGVRIRGPVVVGEGSIVDQGAEVERSVIWERVFVGKGARLFGCIVGGKSIIGERVRVGEGSIIGERCHIEKDSTVNPYVKIWPDKVVEARSQVTMSLVWGGKWYGSLFRKYGVAGISNLEITPEYATKLGCAFGTLFPKGSWMAVSRDSSKSARMIKRAFISGLLSAGINVINLQAMVLPITRYTIRTRNMLGGAHIRMVPQEASLLAIELFDEKGLDIAPSLQRKLEHLFFREDMRRVRDTEVGIIEYSTRVIEEYTEALLSKLDEKTIREANFRVVIDYAFGRTSLVLPSILGRAGLNVVAIHPHIDPGRAPHSPEQRQEMLQELREVTRALRADMGVFFEHSGGESLSLVTKEGRVIEGYELLLLYALILYKLGYKGDIVSYLWAPSAFDKLAHRFGAKVIRTRPSPRALIEASQNALIGGNDRGALVFPFFQPAFDAIFAMGFLLESLAKLGQDLSSLLEEVPSFSLTYSTLPCPWEEKGRIMRLLHGEFADEGVSEYGVLIKEDEQRWVLVLPDASEPYIHLWAEGISPSDAQQLLQARLETIEGYLKA